MTFCDAVHLTIDPSYLTVNQLEALSLLMYVQNSSCAFWVIVLTPFMRLTYISYRFLCYMNQYNFVTNSPLAYIISMDQPNNLMRPNDAYMRQ